MTLKTTEEKLIAVQAAIEKIESGAQEYSIANRRMVRGQLKDLYEREKYLEKKLARERNGGITVKGVSL